MDKDVMVWDIQQFVNAAPVGVTTYEVRKHVFEDTDLKSAYDTVRDYMFNNYAKSEMWSVYAPYLLQSRTGMGSAFLQKGRGSHNRGLVRRFVHNNTRTYAKTREEAIARVFLEINSAFRRMRKKYVSKSCGFGLLTILRESERGLTLDKLIDEIDFKASNDIYWGSINRKINNLRNLGFVRYADEKYSLSPLATDAFAKANGHNGGLKWRKKWFHPD